MVKRIATATVDIDAPVEVVWSVMLDFEKYQEWNPFIFRVTNLPASFIIGSRFLLHVRWANGTTTKSWETLTHLTLPSTAEEDVSTALLMYRYSSWQARSGLVRACREQHLSQRNGQLTNYRTQESFHGLLADFVPLSAVREGFQRHAEALKQRAEWLARNGVRSV